MGYYDIICVMGSSSYHIAANMTYGQVTLADAADQRSAHLLSIGNRLKTLSGNNDMPWVTDRDDV